MSVTIQNVLVIGASGSAGVPIVKRLLAEGFHVSALTRESSSSTFPADVNVLKTDYSPKSLVAAFQGQDAVVSTIASASTGSQKTIIDAAITAGVKVFLPSEFGIDTGHANALEALPMISTKIEIVKYLKSVEDQISWTVVIVGAFFDWSFSLPPSVASVDIAGRRATVFDGGNTPFEATNVGQIAKAVASILKKPEITRNQYVYVNSFTTTPNEVVKALEKATGEKFTIVPASTEAIWKDGIANLSKEGFEGIQARFNVILAALYGRGNVNNYSVSPGLWNERLGLETEDLQETINRIVKESS